MELNELAKLPIIDCHTHFGGEDLDAIDGMLEGEKAGGVERVAIVITSVPTRVSANAQALYAKHKYPERVYFLGGMDYSAISQDVDHRLTYSFPQQVDRLMALGADGIKLINGKPNCRKDSGIALDSVVYEPLFARAEATNLPLLWHVNDPEEFWDPEAAPEWAKGPGWLYDDTYPSNPSLYEETERVLERHPSLTVMFAHFYFLSDFLGRAAALLDRYPNVHLDLAPGIEMLHNFSKRPAEAREFFLKYQDRIVYGTDFSPRFRLSRIWVLRNFLETDETYHVPTDDNLFWPDHRTMITGIKLPEEVLRKIYAGNFARIVSAAPKPLDRPRVMEELNRLTSIHDALGVAPNMPRRVAERLAASG
jgi:predicted TIM-barrel fold metal-dependent hydrolase